MSIERCHVALIVLDASSGIVEQDAHIAGYAYEAGRACILLVNKWDIVDKEARTADEYLQYVRDEFKFLSFAPVLFISAKTGRRVERILDAVEAILPQYRAHIDTPQVNNALQEALRRHSPPVVSNKAVRIKYAVQTSTAPPTFTLFVNDPRLMHFSYERFLVNQFRESFGLDSVPIRIRMRKK
jgi:GTP-binding protein